MDSESFGAATYTLGQLTPTSAQTLLRYSVDSIDVCDLIFHADGALLWSGASALGVLRGDQTSASFYDSAMGFNESNRSFSFADARSGPAVDAAVFGGMADPISALLLNFASVNVAFLSGEWGRLALNPGTVVASTVPEPATLALFVFGLGSAMLLRRRVPHGAEQA